MPALTRNLRVMLKRRKRTLINKIREFSELFAMDIAFVVRDKDAEDDGVLYTSSQDPNWPRGLQVKVWYVTV
jgi:hypothetical protein